MATGDTPGDIPGFVVMNPEAVGDPEQTPVVFVGNDLRVLLRPCACGGVNGFHADECACAASRERVQHQSGQPGEAGCG